MCTAMSPGTSSSWGPQVMRPGEPCQVTYIWEERKEASHLPHTLLQWLTINIWPIAEPGTSAGEEMVTKGHLTGVREWKKQRKKKMLELHSREDMVSENVKLWLLVFKQLEMQLFPVADITLCLCLYFRRCLFLVIKTVIDSWKEFLLLCVRGPHKKREKEKKMLRAPVWTWLWRVCFFKMLWWELCGVDTNESTGRSLQASFEMSHWHESLLCLSSLSLWYLRWNMCKCQERRGS